MPRLIGLLGELYLKTIRRGEGDVDREGLFRIYARDLSFFPGDVVADAIRNYRGKYFPALIELQDSIEKDRRISERRLRIEALRAFLNGEQQDCNGPPPTEAQLERNQRWVKTRKEDTAVIESKVVRLAEVDRLHGEGAKSQNKRNWLSPSQLTEHLPAPTARR